MTRPTLGIVLLDTSFPRIPGDVGNAASYDFPIRLKTIAGATVQRVVFEADLTLLGAFIDGARERPEEFNKRLRYFIRMTGNNKTFGLIR